MGKASSFTNLINITATSLLEEDRFIQTPWINQK